MVEEKRHTGALIREKRLAAQMTQIQLAVAMGWSKERQSYISAVENGEYEPDFENLVKFAKALNCQVWDIKHVECLKEESA